MGKPQCALCTRQAGASWSSGTRARMSRMWQLLRADSFTSGICRNPQHGAPRIQECTCFAKAPQRETVELCGMYLELRLLRERPDIDGPQEIPEPH